MERVSVLSWWAQVWLSSSSLASSTLGEHLLSKYCFSTRVGELTTHQLAVRVFRVAMQKHLTLTTNRLGRARILYQENPTPATQHQFVLALIDQAEREHDPRLAREALLLLEAAPGETAPLRARALLSLFLHSGELIDIAKAFQACQEGYTAGIAHPDFILLFVQILHHYHTLSPQVTLLEKAMALLPQCPMRLDTLDLLFNTALCWFSQRREHTDFIVLDRLFRKAQRKTPCALLYKLWGKFYLLAGRQQQTLGYFSQGLLKIQHALKFEVTIDALILEGELLLEKGELLEEYRYLHRAYTLMKKLPAEECVCYHARVLLAQARYFHNPTLAQEALTLVQKRGDLAALRLRASVHAILFEMTGDPLQGEEAVIYSQKVVEHSPFTPDDAIRLARALFAVAEAKNENSLAWAALEILDRCQALYRTYQWSIPLELLYLQGVVLDFIGDMQMDEERLQQAIGTLSEALRHAPRDNEVAFALGCAQLHHGLLVDNVVLLEAALQRLRHVTRLDPEHDAGWIEQGNAAIAMGLFHAEKHFEEAQSCFLQALSLGNNEGWYCLACLYALTGNLAKSWEYFQQALYRQALPSLEEMLEDDWLQALRETKEFQKLFHLTD